MPLLKQPIPHFKGVSASEFIPSVFYVDVLAVQVMFDTYGAARVKKALSVEFLGDLSYLKGKSDVERVEFETALLRKAGCLGWAGVSLYGKPFYQHFLTYIKLLWPKTDITPTVVDAVQLFCWGFGNGKKSLNLIGCQNSSKSSISARLSFAALMVNIEFSAAYCANPFTTASASTIWGDFLALYEEIKEFYGDANGVVPFFPKSRAKANKQIVLVPNQPKSGTVELRSVKEEGMFIGMKARTPDVGTIIVVVDEINRIPQVEFLNAITNLYSQSILFVITSQNFTNANNAGGEMCKPCGLKGGPNDYSKLHIDRNQAWDSVMRGITLRFDGHLALNVICGRVIYTYAFKEEDKMRIAEGGTHSADYLSQVRSFPNAQGSVDTAIDDEVISASNYKDKFYAFIEPQLNKKVLFVDPALGGKDKALIFVAEKGMARCVEGSGRQTNRELVVFPKAAEELEINRHAIWTDIWYSLCRKLEVEPSGALGSPILPEDQVAILTFMVALREGIPFNHVGYDYSMRDTVVTSFTRYGKSQARSFNYQVKPFVYQLMALPGKDTANARNRVAELAMLTKDMLMCKQIRGGENIVSALNQLANTLVLAREPRFMIEKKLQYKARNGGVSPDDRDAFMGALAMAVAVGMKRGMETNFVPNAKPTNVNIGVNAIFNNPVFQVAKSKKLDISYRKL